MPFSLILTSVHARDLKIFADHTNDEFTRSDSLRFVSDKSKGRVKIQLTSDRREYTRSNMAPSAIRESFESTTAVAVKKQDVPEVEHEKTPLEAISLGEVLPGEIQGFL